MSEKEAYHGPERRTHMKAWRQDVDRRFKDGSDTMRALRADLEVNTAMTKALHDNTKEVVELLQSFRGAMKVLDMLGRLAKPLGYIVALVAGVWGLVAAIKGGGVPPQ